MKSWNVPIANCGQTTTPCHITENRPMSSEFWNSYSSDGYSFLRNMCVGLSICHILLNFRGLVKHIENKNQSARSNFAALKNCIMLNVSLIKTEQNT